MDHEICDVCFRPCARQRKGDLSHVDCPRCGKYSIVGTAEAMLKRDQENDWVGSALGEPETLPFLVQLMTDADEDIKKAIKVLGQTRNTRRDMKVKLRRPAATKRR